jgi:hypothetical protein
LSIDILDIYGLLDTPTAIPMMHRPILFKSNISQGKNAQKKMQMNELLLKIKDLGVLQGIGCMA